MTDPIPADDYRRAQSERWDQIGNYELVEPTDLELSDGVVEFPRGNDLIVRLAGVFDLHFRGEARSA